MANVMIVVASSLMRASLKAVIVRMGHRVVAEAIDGQEALALYHRERPDVVAVDIGIPRLDGLHLIERLRSLDPRVRVIVCTADARREVVLSAIKQGAMDYVLRPFDPERMGRALERATCGLGALQPAC